MTRMGTGQFTLDNSPLTPIAPWTTDPCADSSPGQLPPSIQLPTIRQVNSQWTQDVN